MKTVLVVAAALIDKQGRILIAQRPEGKSLAGMWEFPGGKVESGETPELALIRELEEELGIRCIADDLTAFVFASHTYENFHLLMPLYLIRQWQGKIRLKEHKALEWVYAKDMPNYPMPPADKPLVDYLLKLAFLDP